MPENTVAGNIRDLIRLKPGYVKELVMFKFAGGVVLLIFLIGLAVVIGILKLLF
ncbi:MAG: hypothetical protein ACU0BZ_08355 [Paracoccus sp. (in: a-proteobacteria)]|jgi:hypothetical protein|uniref:hypothetical protein n=1 Tax=Paracoccus sp. TaxID=267 RepID=UPI0040586BA2|tara:strand:+ start:978 stop:1139 length:162 start_codon:yes stop_codon:yes gene_type:complete